jgi:hypothetical protein
LAVLLGPGPNDDNPRCLYHRGTTTVATAWRAGRHPLSAVGPLTVTPAGTHPAEGRDGAGSGRLDFEVLGADPRRISVWQQSPSSRRPVGMLPTVSLAEKGSAHTLERHMKGLEFPPLS